MSVPLPDLHIDYPEADGQPMAESDFQRKPLIHAVEALGVHFQDRPDVYVSGNLFLYYEQGNPRAVVAPDVLVVIGADKHDRRSYLLWQEPKAPDFVLEITSNSTRSEDQGVKRGLYAYLGIREYWQYDPTGDYLTPPLQGLFLEGENYRRIPAGVSAGGVLALHSEVLGLELRLENGELRFYDPAGRKLLTHGESERARHLAEEQVRREKSAREAAEARLAELEKRLKVLQSRSGDN